MSSGLPILATRQGGIPEIVRDGHTGWLADQPTSEHLAQTLRRALETPPDRMAEMGRQASDEIEQICNPNLILEKQIEFRNRIARHPATKPLSLSFPDRLPREGGIDGTINEVLVEIPGWLSSSQVNHRKRRARKSSLKLIDVFNLARENPAFFLKKAVWAITQVRKKFQIQRIDESEAQLESRTSLYGGESTNSRLNRWLGWGHRSRRFERGRKERSPHD
jgi:Glycosyltransferase